MRMILRIFAWLFALAAVFRAGLSLYAAWLAATVDSVGWDMTVESLLTEHVGFLSWTPDLGRSIFPDHFIDWIMAMPALVATPMGALGAAILSWLFFRISR